MNGVRHYTIRTGFILKYCLQFSPFPFTSYFPSLMPGTWAQWVKNNQVWANVMGGPLARWHTILLAPSPMHFWVIFRGKTLKSLTSIIHSLIFSNETPRKKSQTKLLSTKMKFAIIQWFLCHNTSNISVLSYQTKWIYWERNWHRDSDIFEIKHSIGITH